MPIVAKCLNDHKLRIPDSQAAKKVRCPVCQVVFLAPAAEISETDEEQLSPRSVDEPEEEATDEEPKEDAADEEPRKKKRPRRRKKSLGNYRAVRTGLLLLILQILLGMLGMILAVVLAAVAAVRHSEHLGVASILVALAAGIVGGLLGLIGSGMCATVPAETGARGYILASLVLNFVFIGSSIIQRVVPLPGYLGIVAASLHNIIQAGAWIMLIQFLVRLGNYLGQRGFASAAEGLLYSGGLVWFGVVVAPLLGMVIGLLGCAGAVVGLAYGIAMLYGAIRYLLVDYLRLLNDFRALLQGP